VKTYAMPERQAYDAAVRILRRYVSLSSVESGPRAARCSGPAAYSSAPRRISGPFEQRIAEQRCSRITTSMSAAVSCRPSPSLIGVAEHVVSSGSSRLTVRERTATPIVEPPCFNRGAWVRVPHGSPSSMRTSETPTGERVFALERALRSHSKSMVTTSIFPQRDTGPAAIGLAE